MAGELTPLVYPSGSASFCLYYEDDGRSNAYLDAAYGVTKFTCAADAAGCECRVLPPHVDAAIGPAGRSVIFQIDAPRAPREVRIEGDSVTTPDGPAWWHDGAFPFVRIGGYPAGARVVW